MKPGEDEFTETFVRYRRYLIGVAMHYVHDACEAEDVVQEAMLLAWRKWHILDRCAVRDWLVRMTVHRAIDAYRAVRRLRPVAAFEDASESGEDRDTPRNEAVLAAFRVAVQQPEMADQVLARIALSEALHALRKLEVWQQRVLLLTALEFSGPEIARCMRIGLSSVHMYLSTARRALQTKMACSRRKAAWCYQTYGPQKPPGRAGSACAGTLQRQKRRDLPGGVPGTSSKMTGHGRA